MSSSWLASGTIASSASTQTQVVIFIVYSHLFLHHNPIFFPSLHSTDFHLLPLLPHPSLTSSHLLLSSVSLDSSLHPPGTMMQSVFGHRHIVSCVDFSAKEGLHGRMGEGLIATGSHDATILLWRWCGRTNRVVGSLSHSQGTISLVHSYNSCVVNDCTQRM